MKDTQKDYTLRSHREATGQFRIQKDNEVICKTFTSTGIVLKDQEKMEQNNATEQVRKKQESG